MAEFPALPLWTDAYLGDTAHLTTIEHGAYFLLLVTAWRTRDCILPDDDRLLARYARCTAGQWKRLRPILEPFFTVDKSGWRQGRLIDEREAVRQHRESQSARGKAGAAAKALKRKERDAAGVKHKSSARTPSAEAQDKLPTPTPSSEDKSSAAERLQVDPVKDLFDLGVSIMTEAGIDEQKARSNLGKWKKDRGEVEVMKALLECRRDNISEPLEWLTKRLQRARFVSKSGYEYRGSLEAIERECIHRNDNDTLWTVRAAMEANSDGKKQAAG